jgi:hypothetical protein
LKDDPIAISNVCKASPIINPPGCSWHGLAEGQYRCKKYGKTMKNLHVVMRTCGKIWENVPGMELPFKKHGVSEGRSRMI